MLGVSMPIPSIVRSLTRNSAASFEKPGKCSVFGSLGVSLPRYRTVSGLPGLEIFDGKAIVPIADDRLSDVHHYLRPYQPLDRNLIHRAPALAEMDRRVDVGPAVLGGREVCGGVPVPARGHPPVSLLPLK